MQSQINQTIKKFLENRIEQCRILVIGDVMLDRYFYGEVTRISPEAPVPVNRIDSQKDTLGGAANVAHNLACLGCHTYLVGVVGHDYHCDTLKQKLREMNIESSGLIVGREKTTTKVRVLGGHQQMIRLDFEQTTPIDRSVEKKVFAYVQQKMEKGIDAIIISDYKKGMCTTEVCRKLIALAHENSITVFVDPKGRDWEKYFLADYITPNIKELGAVMGYPINNTNDDIKAVAMSIKSKYNIGNVMVTRSEKGISLFLRQEDIHIPTLAQEVFDVSGAGDTVIATFAAAIAGGLTSKDAAYLANFAAGIGVEKVGTYAVGREDIIQRLSHDGILSM